MKVDIKIARPVPIESATLTLNGRELTVILDALSVASYSAMILQTQQAETSALLAELTGSITEAKGTTGRRG